MRKHPHYKQYLPEHLLARLRMCSDTTGVPMQEIVRRLLDTHLPPAPPPTPHKTWHKWEGVPQ